jgi:hypothetical protein
MSSCWTLRQVNEEEDRRRLKEKLKEALERARRNNLLSNNAEREVSLRMFVRACSFVCACACL